MLLPLACLKRNFLKSFTNVKNIFSLPHYQKLEDEPFLWRSFSSRIKLYISGSKVLRGSFKLHLLESPFWLHSILVSYKILEIRYNQSKKNLLKETVTYSSSKIHQNIKNFNSQMKSIIQKWQSFNQGEPPKNWLRVL